MPLPPPGGPIEPNPLPRAMPRGARYLLKTAPRYGPFQPGQYNANPAGTIPPADDLDAQPAPDGGPIRPGSVADWIGDQLGGVVESPGLGKPGEVGAEETIKGLAGLT